MNALERKRPSLQVLDLASPGTAMMGYLGAGSRNVFVKAISTEKGVGRVGRREGSALVSLRTKKAELPGCLRSEPAEYYDHAHFHMPTTYFKRTELVATFDGIGKVLKKGGLLFFSADEALLSGGPAKEDRFVELAGALSSQYALTYQFSDFWRIPRLVTGNAAELAREFGADLKCDRDSAVTFFLLFSEHCQLGRYFAIAVKK